MKYVVIALAVLGGWILIVAAWKRFMDIVDPTPTDDELKRIRENQPPMNERIWDDVAGQWVEFKKPK